MAQLDDSSQGNLCKVISSLQRQMWVQAITQVFADKPLIEEIHNGFCNSGFGLFVFLFFLFISLCCRSWNSCHAIILLSCDNFTINLLVPSKFLALSVFITELTFFFLSKQGWGLQSLWPLQEEQNFSCKKGHVFHVGMWESQASAMSVQLNADSLW